jgi:hypothetical protein
VSTAADAGPTLDASVHDAAPAYGDATVDGAANEDATTGDASATDGSVATDANEGADASDGSTELDSSAASDVTPAEASANDAASADATSDAAESSDAALASDASDGAADASDANGAFSADYTFDTSTQGWTILYDATGADGGAIGSTLTWTNSIGDPTAGALELNAPFSAADQGLAVGFYPSPGLDMTGRVITVNLYLASGLTNDPANWGGFQVYAQSGGPYYHWEGGSFVGINSETSGGNAGQWLTSSIDLGAAAANDPQFDPTNITNWGVQVLTGGSTTAGDISPALIYIDSVTIQ